MLLGAGGGSSSAGRAGAGRGGGANSNSGLRSERSAWMELINDLKKKCAPQDPQRSRSSYQRAHVLLICVLRVTLVKALGVDQAA